MTKKKEVIEKVVKKAVKEVVEEVVEEEVVEEEVVETASAVDYSDPNFDWSNAGAWKNDPEAVKYWLLFKV